MAQDIESNRGANTVFKVTTQLLNFEYQRVQLYLLFLLQPEGKKNVSA